MSKQGTLFLLGRDLKACRGVRHNKKASAMDIALQQSLSVGFFDDGLPIRLTIAGTADMPAVGQWVEELGFNDGQATDTIAFTEDAEYTLMTEWDNDAVNELSFESIPAETYEERDGPGERPQETELPAVPIHPLEGERIGPDPLKALGKAASALDDAAFAADLAAILEGNKVFDPEKKSLVDSSAVSDGFIEKMKEADAQREGSVKAQPIQPKTDAAANANNEHSIFDKIAQHMNFANAFELGSLEMEQRFDAFDREMIEVPVPAKAATPLVAERQPVGEQAEGQMAPKESAAEGLGLQAEDFVTDLGLIMAAAEAMEDIRKDAAWPPRPSGLSPIDLDRKKSLFGMFAYEAAPATDNPEAIRITDDWSKKNIEWVDIPQLTGKISGSESGNRKITNGGMEFHRKGSNQLKSLFADWEKAGLMDRIVTFNGGFVPRYVRGTQPEHRSDQRLSNHAWGSAFDINAEWNPRGSLPALVGQKGSVRELVEIANRHGFFWGGHFGGSSIDGMHFELVQIQ